jgi:hypothetical protein
MTHNHFIANNMTHIFSLNCIILISITGPNDWDPNGVLGNGLLATSTIFMSTGLLRYITVYESFGKLTIMMFAMIYDLFSFAVVFAMCLLGFSVALFSLLHDTEFDGDPDPYFQTYSNTFVTMFSAALGNYDMTMFVNDSPYYLITYIIIMIYLILSALVLVNLVIARMTSTHDNVDEHSFEEWNYAKALSTQQYIMVEEKHPMCMLPAPLNIITTLLIPFHRRYLLNAKSIQGSVLFACLLVICLFV